MLLTHGERADTTCRGRVSPGWVVEGRSDCAGHGSGSEWPLTQGCPRCSRDFNGSELPVPGGVWAETEQPSNEDCAEGAFGVPSSRGKGQLRVTLGALCCQRPSRGAGVVSPGADVGTGVQSLRGSADAGLGRGAVERAGGGRGHEDTVPGHSPSPRQSA